MAKISEQELEMGIASFIEKRGYAGLRVELTPQQALDIYTELDTLRALAAAIKMSASPPLAVQKVLAKWEKL